MKNKSQYYFLALHENKLVLLSQFSRKLEPDYLVKTLTPSETNLESHLLQGSYLHFSSRSSNIAVKLSLEPMGSLSHLDFLHSYRHH